MAIYAIGDVQGCYTELCRLLEKIDFDPAIDTLWFCGDLVNRGEESLQTLRLVKSLGNSALTVLGSHDLHLLALHHGVKKVRVTADLQKILKSPDRDELMHWLQSQSLLHYDKSHRTLVVHAGIYPSWGLSRARKLAAEVETMLRGENSVKFFRKMYGNKPDKWSNDLKGGKRLRFITNAFTRMRYLDPSGKLDFTVNRSPRRYLRRDMSPWFLAEAQLRADLRVLFGHWSTLPIGCYGRFFALDGGCVWGGHLVALRIDNDSEDWFFVDSHTKKPINTAKQ